MTFTAIVSSKLLNFGYFDHWPGDDTAGKVGNLLPHWWVFVKDHEYHSEKSLEGWGCSIQLNEGEVTWSFIFGKVVVLVCSSSVLQAIAAVLWMSYS